MLLLVICGQDPLEGGQGAEAGAPVRGSCGALGRGGGATADGREQGQRIQTLVHSQSRSDLVSAEKKAIGFVTSKNIY